MSNSTHRYHELLLNSFVSARSNLKFCPYPSCTETISSSVGSGSKHTFTTFVPTVTCSNQHSFCFGCHLDSDHRPVLCHWVAQWQKNTREDAGTAQWIKANTRECPKCLNSIEKSGGCKSVSPLPGVPLPRLIFFPAACFVVTASISFVGCVGRVGMSTVTQMPYAVSGR